MRPWETPAPRRPAREDACTHPRGSPRHLAIQYAKVMGLRVCAVDIDDGKLAHAKRLGADLTVNAEGDPASAVRRGGTLAVDNDLGGVHRRISPPRRPPDGGGRRLLYRRAETDEGDPRRALEGRELAPGPPPSPLRDGSRPVGEAPGARARHRGAARRLRGEEGKGAMSRAWACILAAVVACADGTLPARGLNDPADRASQGAREGGP
jgi:hypothetical protein